MSLQLTPEVHLWFDRMPFAMLPSVGDSAAQLNSVFHCPREIRDRRLLSREYESWGKIDLTGHGRGRSFWEMSWRTGKARPTRH
jgi:hypothetical protein